MDFFLKGHLALDVLDQDHPVCSFKNRQLGFLICGVGPLNAAIHLERFLASDSRVQAVLNVGIAGSYDLDQLPLGSVVEAGMEIWPEYGVLTDPFFADPRQLGFPLSGSGSDAVWNRIELDPDHFREKAGLPAVPCPCRGISITVAGVSSSPERPQALKSRFQADIENMEGFALAYCCHLRSIPFAEIRTISNLAGSRDKSDWDFRAAFSSLNTIWPMLWSGSDS